MPVNHRLGRLCFLVFWTVIVGLPATRAQDESLAEIRYREDYDQIQKIVRITDTAKRADQMLAFYKGRSDLDPKLREYADNFFARDLESLHKQGNFVAMSGLAERAIKLRPKFGEAYFFYAVALRHDNKMDEAMIAFAKSYLITNPLQKRAKELLDTTYRSVNKGSLLGEDKLIKKVAGELK
jgi:hypothetical protein